MRFSLNFIKEFVEVDISPHDLAQRLTMAGMEVEYLAKQGDDWVFDIEITTNRYDWLSVLGVAREVAANISKKLKIKYPSLGSKPVFKGSKISLENKEDCPFYVGRIIRGVKVQRSCTALAEKIKNCDINIVNNVVDITNYCMLKWGNPLHAFDQDKLQGDICVRRARPGEKFLGLDGKERVLGPDNLVIADAKGVIALAGVMGAKSTQVDETTKNVFLEAAIFSPLSVRQSRRAAGLDTDSSYRFERRVFPDYLEYASAEAAALIAATSGDTTTHYLQAGHKPRASVPNINLSVAALNSYLGVDLSFSQAKKILSGLDFSLKAKTKDKIVVQAPSFRFDLQREVDIYEEIARVYGYDRILPQLPFLGAQKSKTSEDIITSQSNKYILGQRICDALCLLGLRQAITYSIEDARELSCFGYDDFIRLANPMRQTENVLRPTIFAGLLKAVKHNLNRGQNNIKFFELANVYLKQKERFSERTVLAIAIASEAGDFFYLKGVVREFLRVMNVPEVKFTPRPQAGFTNALEIFFENRCLGFLGKLDGAIAGRFNLRQDIFIAHIEIDILAQACGDKRYQEFSVFPATSRDISLILDKNVGFINIREIIKNKAKEYFCDFAIVDRYRSQKLSPGQRAFTLRLFYQACDRTLTAQEVDDIHGSIRCQIGRMQGVVLR